MISRFALKLLYMAALILMPYWSSLNGMESGAGEISLTPEHFVRNLKRALDPDNSLHDEFCLEESSLQGRVYNDLALLGLKQTAPDVWAQGPLRDTLELYALALLCERIPAEKSGRVDLLKGVTGTLSEAAVGEIVALYDDACKFGIARFVLTKLQAMRDRTILSGGNVQVVHFENDLCTVFSKDLEGKIFPWVEIESARKHIACISAHIEQILTDGELSATCSCGETRRILSHVFSEGFLLPWHNTHPRRFFSDTADGAIQIFCGETRDRDALFPADLFRVYYSDDARPAQMTCDILRFILSDPEYTSIATLKGESRPVIATCRGRAYLDDPLYPVAMKTDQAGTSIVSARDLFTLFLRDEDELLLDSLRKTFVKDGESARTIANNNRALLEAHKFDPEKQLPAVERGHILINCANELMGNTPFPLTTNRSISEYHAFHCPEGASTDLIRNPSDVFRDFDKERVWDIFAERTKAITKTGRTIYPIVIVQVASQINGLEASGREVEVDYVSSFTSYAADQTQGAAAAQGDLFALSRLIALGSHGKINLLANIPELAPLVKSGNCLPDKLMRLLEEEASRNEIATKRDLISPLLQWVHPHLSDPQSKVLLCRQFAIPVIEGVPWSYEMKVFAGATVIGAYRAIAQIAVIQSILTGKPVHLYLTHLGGGAYMNAPIFFGMGLQVVYDLVKNHKGIYVGIIGGERELNQQYISLIKTASETGVRDIFVRGFAHMDCRNELFEGAGISLTEKELEQMRSRAEEREKNRQEPAQKRSVEAAGVSEYDTVESFYRNVAQQSFLEALTSKSPLSTEEARAAVRQWEMRLQTSTARYATHGARAYVIDCARVFRAFNSLDAMQFIPPLLNAHPSTKAMRMYSSPDWTLVNFFQWVTADYTGPFGLEVTGYPRNSYRVVFFDQSDMASLNAACEVLLEKSEKEISPAMLLRSFCIPLDEEAGAEGAETGAAAGAADSDDLDSDLAAAIALSLT